MLASGGYFALQVTIQQIRTTADPSCQRQLSLAPWNGKTGSDHIASRNGEVESNHTARTGKQNEG